jgi:hypothetical protein
MNPNEERREDGHDRANILLETLDALGRLRRTRERSAELIHSMDGSDDNTDHPHNDQ